MRTKWFLMIIVAIMATLFVTVPASAYAEITEQSWSFSEVNLTDTSVADVSTSVKGVLDLRYEVANWKLPKGAKTKLVHGWYNSYRNRAGKLVWLPKGNFRVYRSASSPTGWRKVTCGNIVKPARPAKVYKGKYRVYRYFTYKAAATATAKLTATVKARATATSGGATAEAEGYASGEAYATATATSTGKSLAAARRNAVAGATHLVLKDETTLRSKAQAQARLNLAAAAWARVSAPSVPPTCTPPPDQPCVPHTICVSATYDPVEHLPNGNVLVDLVAAVSGHSDLDAVSYRWNVNGSDYTTLLARYPVELQYDKVYVVTGTVIDAAGHTASDAIPPFNIQGTGYGPDGQPTGIKITSYLPGGKIVTRTIALTK